MKSEEEHKRPKERLSKTDEKILHSFRRGVTSSTIIAEEHNLNRSYVNRRVLELVKRGILKKGDKQGRYTLVDEQDPLEDRLNRKVIQFINNITPFPYYEKVSSELQDYPQKQLDESYRMLERCTNNFKEINKKNIAEALKKNKQLSFMFALMIDINLDVLLNIFILYQHSKNRLVAAYFDSDGYPKIKFKDFSDTSLVLNEASFPDDFSEFLFEIKSNEFLREKLPKGLNEKLDSFNIKNTSQMKNISVKISYQNIAEIINNQIKDEIESILEEIDEEKGYIDKVLKKHEIRDLFREFDFILTGTGSTVVGIIIGFNDGISGVDIPKLDMHKTEKLFGFRNFQIIYLLDGMGWVKDIKLLKSFIENNGYFQLKDLRTKEGFKDSLINIFERNMADESIKEQSEIDEFSLLLSGTEVGPEETDVFQFEGYAHREELPFDDVEEKE